MIDYQRSRNITYLLDIQTQVWKYSLKGLIRHRPRGRWRLRRWSPLQTKRLELPKNIREALRRFLGNVKKVLGPETRIYLFGSFVRGDWLVDSDIDLVVVSPGLRGVPWHERYPLLRRMMPPDIPTDILAYTPEEFEEVRRRSVIIMDAESYWVELTEETLT